MTPGVAPTLHARARFKLLIKLLFPTLGKPTKQEWQIDIILDEFALYTEGTWDQMNKTLCRSQLELCVQ